MVIYTSYFYQVRFFPPNLVPLSTAMWDPQWFHQSKGSDYIWLDKNNVLNGLRATPFVPGAECANLCRGKEECASRDPQSCTFLRTYRKQLDALDFAQIMTRFEDLAMHLRPTLNLNGEIDFALLFYETPSKPCSERPVVQQWFADHAHPIKEWSRAVI